MSHSHLQATVPTTSFDQINRLTLNAVSSGLVAGGTATFGQLTLTGPQSGKIFDTDELFIWNPCPSGAGNLMHMTLAPTTDAHALSRTLHSFVVNNGTGGIQTSPQINDPGNAYWYLPGTTTASTDTGAMPPYNVAAHDPDVRALYPLSPVRPTHAKCAMDVNMGGGHARIRAVPLSKEMMALPVYTLRSQILKDVHTVHKVNVAGTQNTRVTFVPWCQSRRSIGDFSTRTSPNIDSESVTVTADEKVATTVGGIQTSAFKANNYYRLGYNDEFPYGGWVFLFEEISMSAMGAIPLVTITTSLTIQVQLSLEENHYAHRGPKLGLKLWMNKHETTLAQPNKPIVSKASTDAVEAVRPKAGEAGPGPKAKARSKKAFMAPRNTPQGRQSAATAKKIKEAAAQAAKQAAKAVADKLVNANYAQGMAAILAKYPISAISQTAAIKPELRRLKSKGKGRGKGRR